jgi:dTMP kinase
MPSLGQPGGQHRFLVLEGLDGAGTTTLAQRVADALQARGQDVCLTAEPSGGPVGKVLRAHIAGEVDLDARTVALAFTADRADHLARVIRPALEQGRWVVCDRYLLSTLAYQGAEGVDREWILEASRDFERPDLTWFLDISESDRAGRIAARSRTERYEGPELADEIRASYRASIDLLRSLGQEIEILDASPPVDEVLKALLARLDALG